MKKKITLLLLALACAATCAFGISACGGQGDTHDYATKWTTDGGSHWHECKKPDCNIVKDYGSHVDNDANNYCDVCNMQMGSSSEPVLVESIELNFTELTLPVYGGEILKVTFNPENATERTVTWSSSAPDVVKVGKDGKLAALKEGSAIITATSKNGKEATCKVTVKNNTHEHNLTPVPAVAPTCDKDGHEAYYTCDGCDMWFRDEQGKIEIAYKDMVIIQKSHTLTLVPAEPAQCEVDGNTAYYTCDKCNKWFEDELGTTEITDHTSVTLTKGHTITHVNEKPATCDENGYAAHYACEKCEKWFEDELGATEITDKSSIESSKTGHTMTAVPETPATCDADGNRAYYTCDKCGKWYEDELGTTVITDHASVVLTKAHKLTHVEAKTPTCTEKGNKEYYECQVCEKRFSDENGATEITNKNSVYIAVVAHKFVDGVCSVCGRKKPTAGIAYGGGSASTYAYVSGIGTATDTDIVIADYYNGKPVTGIDGNAFENCTKITSVTLPDTITSINGSAFCGCSNMTSINIPESVTRIGNYAFSRCYALKSVTIPSGITEIYENTFSSCVELTEITVPEGVQKIGDYAFSSCSKLSSVSLPESLTTVGKNVFTNCVALSSLSQVSGLKIIGEYMFSGCTGLSVIAIPETVSSVGKGAFMGCAATGVIVGSGTNSEYSLYVNQSAFSSCTNLTAIYYRGGTKSESQVYVDAYDNDYYVDAKDYFYSAQEPEEYGDFWHYDTDNVTPVIWQSKFTVGLTYYTSTDHSYVSNMGSATDTDIRIAGKYRGLNVTSISAYAFQSHNITSIILPASITSIGNSAFSGCSSLTATYFEGTAEDWAKITIADYNEALTANVYFYSQDPPTESGKYWHYDTDGVTPVIWTV